MDLPKQKPIPTELRLALDACGLSLREAAEMLGVRLDSVDKAARGKERTPPAWMKALRELHQKQRCAADQALDLIKSAHRKQRGGFDVPFNVATDDVEAQAPSLGWPCVGAQVAVARMIWADLPSGVTITPVPRGSTEAAGAVAVDAQA